MPRKGPYQSDNTTPDGDYIVGKGRPPQHSRFKKGDGRRRGRRPKGTKNLATDLREELASSVTLTVGGVSKQVSRQRAIVMRMTDNATKGQTSAIALTLDLQQRLVDPLQRSEAEQAQPAQRQPNMEALSDAELDVLLHLLGQSGCEGCASDRIVGVIPIYKAGEYISDRERKAIADGLAAYGVEVDDRLNFPPRCRLVSPSTP